MNQKDIPRLFNIAKRKVLLEHFCNFWRLLYRIKGLGRKRGWNDFRIYRGACEFFFRKTRRATYQVARTGELTLAPDLLFLHHSSLPTRVGERPIRLDDRGGDSCAHRHHARQSQGNGGKRLNGKDVNGKRNAKSYSPATRHKLPDPVPGTR